MIYTFIKILLPDIIDYNSNNNNIIINKYNIYYYIYSYYLDLLSNINPDINKYNKIDIYFNFKNLILFFKNINIYENINININTLYLIHKYENMFDKMIELRDYIFTDYFYNNIKTIHLNYNIKNKYYKKKNHSFTNIFDFIKYISNNIKKNIDEDFNKICIKYNSKKMMNCELYIKFIYLKIYEIINYHLYRISESINLLHKYQNINSNLLYKYSLYDIICITSNNKIYIKHDNRIKSTMLTNNIKCNYICLYKPNINKLSLNKKTISKINIIFSDKII
jgi:hypothetical protein